MSQRNIKGNKVKDASLIANTQYNEASGAQKQVDVGPKLSALPDGTPAGTTNAATAVALPSKGRSVAVYNNAGAVGAVTFGTAGVAALAPGATNANGEVGIPCPPNQWTFLSAGDATHVRTSAATLLVFLIEDETSLVVQTTR